MKIDILKNIIKEAVRESIREELKNLLVEIIRPESTVKENRGIVKSTPKVESVQSNDPITEILNITKNSMNSQDYSDILSTGYRPQFQEINLTTNSIVSSTASQGVQPGIDITKLDFVKNAALIYNRSVEKDKARLV